MTSIRVARNAGGKIPREAACSHLRYYRPQSVRRASAFDVSSCEVYGQHISHPQIIHELVMLVANLNEGDALCAQPHPAIDGAEVDFYISPFKAAPVPS